MKKFKLGQRLNIYLAGKKENVIVTAIHTQNNLIEVAPTIIYNGWQSININNTQRYTEDSLLDQLC